MAPGTTDVGLIVIEPMGVEVPLTLSEVEATSLVRLAVSVACA